MAVWFRDQLCVGEKMPPYATIGLTPSPKANFVKFKEWLSVTEKGSYGRKPPLFSRPFARFVEKFRTS